MSIRSVRKGLELFFIDIIIIVGIFILQFRTDSNIIEKIGNLQVTLIKSETADNSQKLQNKFQLSYNGLHFHSDDQLSARVRYKDSKSFIDLKLLDYEKEDNGFTFIFSEDVKVSFVLNDLSEESPLTVNTSLPPDAEALYFPYNFSYSMKVTKDEGNRILLASKKSAWSFTTNQIQDGFVYFTNKDSMAHYATYDDTKRFTLDSLIELASADESTYKNTAANIKNNLISSFKAAPESSKTEQIIVAYVAAMSENGKYQQAVDEIPSSFKKSEKRTYVSAPYFNNLNAMDATLDKDIALWEQQISDSYESDSLEAFATEDFASHLCISSNRGLVLDLLNKVASSDISGRSLADVTGIIQTYNQLVVLNKDLASILSPVISSCIKKIEDSCNYENEVLTISENDQFLSVLQAVDIGLALMDYGNVSSNQVYTKAGRVIINSYISETSFDLKTLAYLYPKFNEENTYYPHIKIINSNPDDIIWAWTCAKDIVESRDTEDNLTLTIDFPEEYIHYVIFKGLPKFTTIYIYDLAFRTDPRFETYNSSGYVYKENTYTLLLKSRHKSSNETVRMVYSGLPTRKPKPKNSVTASSSKKYSVILGASPASKKKDIINAIRNARPDLSSDEADELFDNAPVTLMEELTESEAEQLIKKIIDAGGTASKK